MQPSVKKCVDWFKMLMAVEIVDDGTLTVKVLSVNSENDTGGHLNTVSITFQDLKQEDSLRILTRLEVI